MIGEHSAVSEILAGALMLGSVAGDVNKAGRRISAVVYGSLEGCELTVRSLTVWVLI